MNFFMCRDNERLSILVHLLKTIVQPGEQTVVFVATKHHADFLAGVSFFILFYEDIFYIQLT